MNIKETDAVILATLEQLLYELAQYRRTNPIATFDDTYGFIQRLITTHNDLESKN